VKAGKPPIKTVIKSLHQNRISILAAVKLLAEVNLDLAPVFL
jgi:hypothetical protein